MTVGGTVASSSHLLGAMVTKGLADLLIFKPNPKILHSAFQISAAVVARSAILQLEEESSFFRGSNGDGVAPKHFRSTIGSSTALCDFEDCSWEWREGIRLSRNSLKVYDINLKPLFSAFYPKALLMAGIRALLLNYIAVLEAYLLVDDEDEDSPPPPRPVPDLVEPLISSLWTASREVTVVTARRILERIVVRYVEQRRANKLTKDYYDSALRKAAKGIHNGELVSKVCVTTFRCQLLSIAAQWIVQVSLESFKSAKVLYDQRNKRTSKEDQQRIVTQQLTRVARLAAIGAVKGFAALIGASIGAGIGSHFWVGTGTWIGFVLGDLASPHIVTLIFGEAIFKL